jgi:hypothetical protein
MADDRFPDHMPSGFEPIDDHPKFVLGCGRGAESVSMCGTRTYPADARFYVGIGTTRPSEEAVVAALAAVHYSGRNLKQFTLHNNFGIAHKIGDLRQMQYWLINEIFALFPKDGGSNPGSSGTAGMMPRIARPFRCGIRSTRHVSLFDRSTPP